MKSRKCWSCKSSLSYNHFCSQNRNLDNEILEKLWQSNYVEILCCTCYRNMKRQQQKENEEKDKIQAKLRKNNLKSSERYALKALETKLGIKLPFNSSILDYGAKGFFSASEHILGLALSLCALKTIPEELLAFKSLKVLNLDFNLIEKYPLWFKNLVKSKNLRIYYRKAESFHDLFEYFRNFDPTIEHVFHLALPRINYEYSLEGLENLLKNWVDESYKGSMKILIKYLKHFFKEKNMPTYHSTINNHRDPRLLI